MTTDPLLSDDLTDVLRSFPDAALSDLVSVLKPARSLTPFPADRAYDAHALPPGSHFAPHAQAIAKEVLWWGSNEMLRQFGSAPAWLDLLRGTAKHVGLPEKKRARGLPAWKIEDAIFSKALEAWERLSPEQREAAMKSAGMDLAALRGAVTGAAAAVGRDAVKVGAQRLLSFLGPRFAGAAVPGVGPLLVAAATFWSAYDVAGPGYRVLRPATLVIAYHRRRLRDARLASAFRE